MESWQLMASMSQRRTEGPRKGTFARVLRFAAGYRHRLAGLLVLTTFDAGIAVATPVLAGRVVNAVVAHRPIGTVVWLATIIAVIALVSAGLSIAERWVSAQIGEGLIHDLRRAVFDHVQRMPLAFFTRTRTGALVSRLNNDVIGAQRAFTTSLSGVVTNTIQLILSVVVMIALSWQVTVIALLIFPLMLIPARRVGRRLADLRREAAGYNAQMNDQMTERFSAPGATLVKLFGNPATESAEFGRRAAKVRDIGVRSAMATRWFSSGLTLLPVLAQAMVYGFGGALALSGALDAGTVVSLALLLTRLYAPMAALANAPVDVVTALVSFERVFEVLDLPSRIVEPEHPRALVHADVSVEFDDVRFSYPAAGEVSLASLEDVATLDIADRREVLRGVSFRVPPGALVALVGSSGAGKSTIASLVPRLYDVDSGAVRLAGVDVRELRFDDIRRTVGVVSQDGHLFHDTIRANLRYADPEASERELTEAVRRARLSELIATLPDGLDTVVGERGYRLSGGERQR
ncbi:MAG: ABC transporter ATP-binding protein, partial [Sciscionella sp.]